METLVLMATYEVVLRWIYFLSVSNTRLIRYVLIWRYINKCFINIFLSLPSSGDLHRLPNVLQAIRFSLLFINRPKRGGKESEKEVKKKPIHLFSTPYSIPLSNSPWNHSSNTSLSLRGVFFLPIYPSKNSSPLSLPLLWIFWLFQVVCLSNGVWCCHLGTSLKN